MKHNFDAVSDAQAIMQRSDRTGMKVCAFVTKKVQLLCKAKVMKPAILE